MNRPLRRIAALATALLLSACATGGETRAAGSPASAASEDTAALCAKWMQAQQPFLLGTAPEAKAYNAALAAAYQGKPPTDALEIQRAFWSSWADEVRPLLAEATTPALREALTSQVTELDRRAAATEADLSAPPALSAGELCL